MSTSKSTNKHRRQKSNKQPMNEFEHGGDVKSFAKKIGCDDSQIIDLSSNINFVKPKVKLKSSKIDFASYPNYNKLKKVAAKFFKTKKQNIELFNGGSSAIFSLFRNLPNEKCVIYSPAYLEYKKATILHNKELALLNRYFDSFENIPNNSLIVFVNPSTPDGKNYKIKKLLKTWKEKNCTVIIDESFLDFSKKKSYVNQIDKYENIYILKSMTKIFGCAGVRLGVIISNQNNIAKLQTKEPLWKISSLDSSFIIKAIKQKGFLKKSYKKNKNAKKYLKQTLSKSGLFSKIYKSDANFILAKLKNQNASHLQHKLLKDKILIRECGNFDFLDNRFVRFAVKDKAQLKKLNKSLNG